MRASASAMCLARRVKGEELVTRLSSFVCVSFAFRVGAAHRTERQELGLVHVHALVYLRDDSHYLVEKHPAITHRNFGEKDVGDGVAVFVQRYHSRGRIQLEA